MADADTSPPPAPRTRLTTERKLEIATIRLRKLEAELDNVKDVYFQLAQRVLKLELSLSLELQKELTL